MHVNNIEWKKASLFFEVSKLAQVKLSNGAIQLFVTYNLPGVETAFESVYTFHNNGVIKIENTLNASEYKGDIPRVGMRMQIQKEFDSMTYFGRGPWENYQDRKASAFVDLYQSKVADQYVPYIRPQENGYKTNVRWVAFSNGNNNGLLVVAAHVREGLGVSALHMENEDFDATAGLDYGNSNTLELKYRIDGIPEINTSKHTTDIKEKDLIQLNIDLDQRGVGGDDSWYSKPQKKYQLKSNDMHSYSFYLIPFQNKTKQDFIKMSKNYGAKQ